jgi:hypothetical protein
VLSRLEAAMWYDALPELRVLVMGDMSLELCTYEEEDAVRRMSLFGSPATMRSPLRK